MRNIPEDNLAYPVLINISTGSGSGFVLRANESLYLITAKHVLFDNDKLRSDKIQITCQTQSINDNSVRKIFIDFNVVAVSSHRDADIAAVKLATTAPNPAGGYLIHYINGVQVIQDGKSPTIQVETTNGTKLISEVLVSNDVFLYGYPTSLGLKDLPQFDYSKPLLRKGIIANVYPEKGTIILDCPAYFGNSGGPVVEVDLIEGNYHHKVIGVVSQFIPFVQEWVNPPTGIKNVEFVNSGYSVATSMDKVFELIGYNQPVSNSGASASPVGAKSQSKEG